jgi:hypothetical protein
MQDPGRLGSPKFGLWRNWIFVLLTAVGWLGIAHFYLPARANLGLDATKVRFSETHHWGVIIGCTLFYFAAAVLTPGSITFGIMLPKIEGGCPLWSLTYRGERSLHLVDRLFQCLHVDRLRFERRAGRTSARPLATERGSLSCSADRRRGTHRPHDRTDGPRWLTWLTIAGALTVFFAAGPAFFKSGPFAYHGLPAFYVPVVISGAYMVLTTWYMLKELKRAPESTPIPAAASIADPA